MFWSVFGRNLGMSRVWFENGLRTAILGLIFEELALIWRSKRCFLIKPVTYEGLRPECPEKANLKV